MSEMVAFVLVCIVGYLVIAWFIARILGFNDLNADSGAEVESPKSGSEPIGARVPHA